MYVGRERLEEAQKDYQWIDEPRIGWMASKWDWTHVVVFIWTTLMFIIPGAIFLIWKILARLAYLQEKSLAEKIQGIAYERTGCNIIWSVLHLGPHPKLPFNQRILIGINSPNVFFYDFKLNQLHSLPVASTIVRLKTLQNVYGGSVITTENKVTVIWEEVIKERKIEAEFDFRPFNPNQFIQEINKQSIG